jgi:hypothetical protein
VGYVNADAWARDLVKKFDKALVDFGTYTYKDKGMNEIADFDQEVVDLKELPPERVGEILGTLAKMWVFTTPARIDTERLAMHILHRLGEESGKEWMEKVFAGGNEMLRAMREDM